MPTDILRSWLRLPLWIIDIAEDIRRGAGIISCQIPFERKREFRVKSKRIDEALLITFRGYTCYNLATK